jgi:hypothetical protein
MQTWKEKRMSTTHLVPKRVRLRRYRVCPFFDTDDRKAGLMVVAYRASLFAEKARIDSPDPSQLICVLRLLELQETSTDYTIVARWDAQTAVERYRQFIDRAAREVRREGFLPVRNKTFSVRHELAA